MRNALVPIAVGLVLFGAACGGKKSTPTGPTAGATPTPAPTAQPTPTPTPTSSPVLTGSCRSLPPATGVERGCTRGSPSYFSLVKDAVDLAASSTYRDPISGQVFEVVSGDGRIQVASAYIKIVNEALDRRGLCSAFDGEEIRVREHNFWNENYDIITSDGRSWVNYVVTCAPALPVPQPAPVPPQQDPTCPLPPSASIVCARQEAVYDGDIFAAQDAVIEEDRARATPRIFNFGDRFSGQVPYGYRIIDEPLYTTEMLKKLKARGYCAFFDGGEFVVKRTNVFSEHYDMTRADGYAIRLYGSTCRDAGF
jgi:hypothetical protein